MKESEIRPKEIFEEYLRLSKLDIENYFSDKSKFVEINCPACDTKSNKIKFIKHDFIYRFCENCSSLYVSPRPTPRMISDFYKKSNSSKYWAEFFYPKTSEPRRDKIYAPRAKKIYSFLKSNKIKNHDSIIDVGAGYGIFLEEIKKLNIFKSIIGIEPNKDLAAACKKKNLVVIEKKIEDVNCGEISADFVCSFEVFEHLYDPSLFIGDLKKITNKGGFILFTTLTYSGFDLLTLGENSNSISPPHHINFMSIEGIKKILNSNNLKEISITTPGKLDLDLVINKMNDSNELIIPEFIRYLIEKRGEKVHKKFQEFLQDSNLSSHVWVLAQKIND